MGRTVRADVRENGSFWSVYFWSVLVAASSFSFILCYFLAKLSVTFINRSIENTFKFAFYTNRSHLYILLRQISNDSFLKLKSPLKSTIFKFEQREYIWDVNSGRFRIKNLSSTCSRAKILCRGEQENVPQTYYSPRMGPSLGFVTRWFIFCRRAVKQLWSVLQSGRWTPEPLFYVTGYCSVEGTSASWSRVRQSLGWRPSCNFCQS